jgi:hypothetical protein
LFLSAHSILPFSCFARPTHSLRTARHHLSTAVNAFERHAQAQQQMGLVKADIIGGGHWPSSLDRV